jgi:pyruvate/2-oxoglutarate dehydrogenase complex dihydrolipoamide dehydrogenase (E3) component
MRFRAPLARAPYGKRHGRLFEAGKVFLNVGGRATVPDMPGRSDIDYLTNVGILKLDTVPEHR